MYAQYFAHDPGESFLPSPVHYTICEHVVHDSVCIIMYVIIGRRIRDMDCANEVVPQACTTRESVISTLT